MSNDTQSDEYVLKPSQVPGILFVLDELKRAHGEAQIGPHMLWATSEEWTTDQMLDSVRESLAYNDGNRMWGISSQEPTFPDGAHSLYFNCGNGPKAESRARYMGALLTIAPDLFPIFDFFVAAIEAQLADEVGPEAAAEIARTRQQIAAMPDSERQQVFDALRAGSSDAADATLAAFLTAGNDDE